ncbi:MAG: patatin-like phospholipase family protein [Candidatus Eremiobacteraeota bacterium]|nr:patatin-like phospholipase family protein [Candidatus Eremiobacteraeota bacterium]
MTENARMRRGPAPGGTKRLLALDGGGIRGLISIEIAGRLETLLRSALGAGADFVLADYFDYIAGTSTGAIIATALSLGYRVDQVRTLYLEGAKAMFRRAPLLKQLHYRNVATYLTTRLRELLRGADGEELTLGTDALRTLLLVVMKNATTNSPWPLSNNPAAMFNDRSRDGCNLDLPLWQIVRASTATPTLFPPEDVTVGGQRYVFVDGAVSVYNNPAFLLFLMATLPEYRLGWQTGEEKLLLVSIGTGAFSGGSPALQASHMNLLYNAMSVPLALIEAAHTEQDVLCRVFGRCRCGGPIDSEIGDFIQTEEAVARDGGGPFWPKKFTYLRYDPDISSEGLAALGLPGIRSEDVQKMDSPSHVADLVAVGKAYAATLDLSHFGNFPVAPARDR